MNKKIEVEIKFPLLNEKEVLEYLDNNAKFKYEARQIDEYFNAPHRDFTSKPRIYEWLRLRNSNGKCSFNYKDYSHEVYCDEYETEISSYEHLELILKAMNFKSLVVVDKHRKAYDFEDVEVSIDTVADLGGYIEIEYKGNNENIEEIRKHLFNILERISAKTGELDKKGYPYELLIKKGFVKKNLTP